jgi:hypothetical protein
VFRVEWKLDIIIRIGDASGVNHVKTEIESARREPHANDTNGIPGDSSCLE